MNKNKIQKVLMQVIDDNSGGAKLIQIINGFAKVAKDISPEFLDLDAEQFLDVVEVNLGALVARGKLSRLVYTWQRINREKIFYYTP